MKIYCRHQAVAASLGILHFQNHFQNCLVGPVSHWMRLGVLKGLNGGAWNIQGGLVMSAAVELWCEPLSALEGF